jgi:hypothetical protein
MYIEKISVKNFKGFKSFENLDFLYPSISKDKLAKVFKTENIKYKNINIVLGNNSFGKTAFLKAIALPSLGPSVNDIAFPKRMWLRRSSKEEIKEGRIFAQFVANEQDKVRYGRIEGEIRISNVEGNNDTISWDHIQLKEWHPVYEKNPSALFLVGYGASRTVELPENFKPAERKSGPKDRQIKIQSLFEDTYQLIPLNAWLPAMREKNPGRYVQFINLLAKITGDKNFRITEQLDGDQFIFEKNGVRIPFDALSDGYRAFVGWVGDLLYHIEKSAPSGRKLVENEGIVLIDEIDLHLHPAWQMKILPLLANALPKIQFIVTTHSPLIVGSVQWQNVIYLKQGKDGWIVPDREERNTFGLDADQILVSDFFGLQTSRNNETADQLRNLSLKAAAGNSEARTELMEILTKGSTESSGL